LEDVLVLISCDNDGFEEICNLFINKTSKNFYQDVFNKPLSFTVN